MKPASPLRTSYLAAEGAEVLGVLGHLDLLDLLPQRGTIAGAVLADDPDLLRALRLRYGKHKIRMKARYMRPQPSFPPLIPDIGDRAPKQPRSRSPTAKLSQTRCPLYGLYSPS